MELTVIFRLLKEPGSAVISVLSDSVDISINLCAVKSATEPFKMRVVDLCTPGAEPSAAHPPRPPPPSPLLHASSPEILGPGSRGAGLGSDPRRGSVTCL